jgi:hypothetical protein
MSNISNRHNVVSFVSGKSEALTGQRLVVAKYKSTAKTPAKYPNVCASIPPLALESISDIPDALLPHINSWILEQQDGLFKSVYESNGGVLTTVSDDELGIPAIIGYLSAVSVSGRLTKESIESWYKSEMEGVIKITAAVKKGFIGADEIDSELQVTDAQEIQLELVSNSYRDLFSGLAGGATKYASEVQASLLRMLGLVEESTMQERLVERVKGMNKVQSIAEYL